MKLAEEAKGVLASFSKLDYLLHQNHILSQLLLISGCQTVDEMRDKIEDSESVFSMLAEGEQRQNIEDLPNAELAFGLVLHEALREYEPNVEGSRSV